MMIINKDILMYHIVNYFVIIIILTLIIQRNANNRTHLLSHDFSASVCPRKDDRTSWSFIRLIGITSATSVSRIKTLRLVVYS